MFSGKSFKKASLSVRLKPVFGNPKAPSVNIGPKSVFKTAKPAGLLDQNHSRKMTIRIEYTLSHTKTAPYITPIAAAVGSRNNNNLTAFVVLSLHIPCVVRVVRFARCKIVDAGRAPYDRICTFFLQFVYL